MKQLPGQPFAQQCLGFVVSEEALADGWLDLERTRTPGERGRVAADERAPAFQTGTGQAVPGAVAVPTACGRCGGLMVAIEMNELTLERELGSLVGLRCVSCGEILDPVILANRECQQALGHGRRRPAGSYAARRRARPRPGLFFLSEQ